MRSWVLPDATFWSVPCRRTQLRSARKEPLTWRVWNPASALRVQDAEASRQFFAQLGFQTVWEHREAEGFPLFLEIRRDAVSLFLSEHKGDGPLGVYIYVVVDDAQSLFDEFCQTTAEPTQPTFQPWGHLVFSIDDLEGNHLSFGSPIPTDN